MSCAACSARVDRAVRDIEGVESCSVNLLTADLTVTGDVSKEDIERAVVKAGYGISEEDDTLQDRETPKLIKRLALGIGFLLALMYISMGRMWGLPQPALFDEKPWICAALQLLLSTVIIIINRGFFISGVKAVINRAPNMDTLVSVGSSLSYVYSIYIFALMVVEYTRGTDTLHYLHQLYFESCAMILVLITVGKTLEAKAKGKTTDAIMGLMELAPKTANLIRDGAEVRVPIDEVKVGDIFIVRPGEKIPTDAVVLEGEGSVDESALSGESIPVDKYPDSQVFAATVNKFGLLKCRAERVGEGTTLAAITRMVKDASSTKAPIAKVADKVSGVFVPVVLGICFVTLVGWLLVGADMGYAVSRAISVVVISCPCALGLATPVAIMVGTGVGARNGILFKNATALEHSGRIKTVILDKTGTITKGEPSVTDVIAYDEITESELIYIGYNIELGSEHPLARAICEYGEKNGVEKGVLSEFNAILGKGVEGCVDGKRTLGVSYEYAKACTAMADRAEADYLRLTEEGKTPLFFIQEDRLLGIIAVADTVKEDAADATRQLSQMGIKVVMLTGDNERTARAVAKSVNIDEVVAGVLPGGKKEVVERYSKESRVAMVGDGINDAPALAAADLGIAMGKGSDVAIDSGEVVLMSHGLGGVPDTLSLGRKVLRNIKENLAWAFVYNIIGIPLAAGLFGLSLNPMFGAFAMSLSSFCVVTNALRLNMWKPKKIQVDAENETKKYNKREINVMTKVFNVEGMMCPHCEARVKKALEALDGVSAVTPSHTENKVTVECIESVSDELICKAITDQGYDVRA